MSLAKFRAAYADVYGFTVEVRKYLTEAKKRLGDDGKNLDNINAQIKKIQGRLKNQNYQVAVIAPMKAGKSTFLNAVIGADILAHESDSCTVCETHVRHIDSDKTPRLIESQGSKRQPIIFEGDDAEIKQHFLSRTREIRASGNSDNSFRFEIEHPIEAVGSMDLLKNFTLIDIPGPDEWKSGDFDSTSLKETAIRVLHDCNVILFILDYTRWQNETTQRFFDELKENREEFLKQCEGRVYFILNKIDMRRRTDPEIHLLLENVKKKISSFGFVDPIVYPVSSRKALLAKLIRDEKATEDDILSFEDEFLPIYRNRETRTYPTPQEIASQALEDSKVPEIEEVVIRTVIQKSGWDLLNDSLQGIEKAINAIDDTLKFRQAGWQTKYSDLKVKVKEYEKKTETAQKKVNSVKLSVDQQKSFLVSGFQKGISGFAEGAKAAIERELNRIAKERSVDSNAIEIIENIEVQPFVIPDEIKAFGQTAIGALPVPSPMKIILNAAVSLLDMITGSPASRVTRSPVRQNDPYKIKFSDHAEAKCFADQINTFFVCNISDWWIQVEEELINQGTFIQEVLSSKIQADIQAISNELSSYLGETLDIKLKPSPITKISSFEVKGIYTEIQEKLVALKRYDYETVSSWSFCLPDDVIKSET
ncbi:MAG: dynamin family protein, partial [Pseudanabaena sp.]